MDVSQKIIKDLTSFYMIRRTSGDEAILDIMADFLDLPMGKLVELLELNESNHLPYHNMSHLLDVALAAVVICKAQGRDNDFMANAFVAGLLHDMNHTRVAKPDSDNIALVKRFTKKIQTALQEMVDVALVERMVAATNTDTPFEEVDEDVRFMRDADLMGWIYRSVLGC